MELIKEMLKDGRVEIAESSRYFLSCEKCHCSIRSGRFCLECATALAGGVQRIYFEEVGERPRVTRDAAKMHHIHQNTFSDSRYSGAQVFYNKEAGASMLASSTQSLFVNAVNPGSNRKCKPASGVYLMEHIKQPGILVECGFLSNPEEEAQLRSKEYQQRICCVITSAVSEYFRTLDGQTND